LKIENLERLKEKLRQKIAEKLVSPNATAGESVIVGYTAAYAVYVHENLEAAHGQMYNAKYADEIAMTRAMKAAKIPKGSFTEWHDRGPNQQAKFLEQPARELSNSGELANDINQAVAAGAKLQDALLIGAVRIQRESQLIVPIDTGNLRGSSFTARE
jgi:hypothetical protein